MLLEHSSPIVLDPIESGLVGLRLLRVDIKLVFVKITGFLSHGLLELALKVLFAPLYKDSICVDDY